MSPARRRRRRSRGGGEGAGESQAQAAAPPFPEWQWRTLPVFFALSLGLFVGMYLVLFVAEREGPFAGDGLPQTIVLIVAAGMLGLSISRIFSRFLVRRRIIKPRSRRA